MADKIKLTADEKKILKANYSHMTTAAKFNYTLPVYQSDLIKLNDIYHKYVGKANWNMSCKKCILKLLTALHKFCNEQGISESK